MRPDQILPGRPQWIGRSRPGELSGAQPRHRALPWREEEMQLAVPPSHPLAGRDQVYPADLNGIEYVAFDEDLSIRRELDRFLRAEGVEVHVACTSTIFRRSRKP